MRRIHILNVPIDTGTMGETIQEIVDYARGIRHSSKEERTCAQVFFINAHCGNVSATNGAYRTALREADAVYPDGSGIILAGKLSGTPIEENVNGTDLFPLLMAALEKERSRVFFIGSRRSVIARLVAEVPRRWPGVQLTGWTIGYFTEDQEVIDAVKAFGADVIFVGMGVPRQELWIHTFADRTGAKVALAVGGLFDFYSGIMPRAPLWMRRLGVEWLFRLAMEPGRMWRRYILGNGLFLARVIARRRRGAHQ